MPCSNDRCLVSTHQEMFKDYDRKRDVRLFALALPSFHQTLRCNRHCPPSTQPCAAAAFRVTAQQVDDVRRFGDKGTFFTGHDILDHGHRRKPQTFDG